MMRVCAEPGCPKLIPADPEACFCDDHFDRLEVEALLEDEGRSTLEQWEEQAQETLGRLLHAQGDELHVLRYATDQLLAHIPYVHGALHDEHPWRAVRHALRIGLMAGLIEASPDHESLKRKIDELWPDASLGRNVRANLRTWSEAGADERRGDTKLSAEKIQQLRAEYDAELANGDERTPTCRTLGRRYGISLSTALRYTR